MRLKIYVFVLVLLVCSVTNAQKVKEVSVCNEQGKLIGTYTLPKGVKNPPVVIFISGSGPTDRDGNNPMASNNSLKLLSDALVAQGIATIRYDKQGVGGSSKATKPEAELVFQDFVKDLVLWIDFAHNQKGLGEITLIGHSEGSLIALLAAEQREVKQVISIAGAGRPIDEILIEQVSAQDEKLGAETRGILEKLKRGEEIETISRDLSQLFRASVRPYILSWMAIDPSVVASRLKVPVVVIQGDKDIQVSVKDAIRLHELANISSYHLIKGMNHVLKYIEGDLMENRLSYMNATLPVMQELIDVIVPKIKE